MSAVTSPVILDETGKELVSAMNSVAEAVLQAPSLAHNYASEAATSAAEAAESQRIALSASGDAEAARDTAVTSASEASTSASQAASSEAQAVSSATSAIESATSASHSATAAATSATTAESAAATVSGLIPQINANTAQIQQNTAQTQQNTAAALANKKRIENIQSLLSGEVYTEATDSTVAYTKLVGDETVTGGAEVMPYAGVETLGGKTIVWNQGANTLTPENYNYHNCTVSFEDGVASITATTKYGFLGGSTTNNIVPIVGHKYYMSGEFSFDALPSGFVRYDVGNTGYSSSLNIILSTLITKVNTWTKASTVAEYSTNAPQSDRSVYVMDSSESDWVNIKARNLQLFDLTLMFGAGNEPATVEEFEAMFPADYYEYNAGTLMSAGVTEVKSLGKMRVWNQQWRTINNENVYTDASAFEFRDFYLYRPEYLHPPVSGHKYLILFSLECSGFENVVIGGSTFMQTNISTPAVTDSNVNTANIVPALKGEKKTFYWLATMEGNLHYEASDFYYLRFRLVENFVGTIRSVGNCFDLTLMFGAGNEPATVEEFEAMFPADYYPYDAGTENVIGSLPIPDAVQALEGYGWSAGTAKNWIDWEAKVFHREVGSRKYAETDASDTTIITDGTTTYYPLEAPELIDISDILTDDNLISVQEGGIITFQNQHGEDFQIPVPSSVSYLCKLSEETTA